MSAVLTSDQFLTAVAKCVDLTLVDIDDCAAPDNVAQPIAQRSDAPPLRCLGVWDDIKDAPTTFGIGKGKYSSVNPYNTTLAGALAAICGNVTFYYGGYSQERKATMSTFAPSVLRDWTAPTAYTDAGGRRHAPKNLRQENVAEITLLVADVDDGMTLPEVTRKLNELGVAYGVYATPSFTKAKPKFRIVVAMAGFKIATPEDRAVYAETYRLVMNALGITEFDQSCMDVNQYYYSANFPMPKPWPAFYGAVAVSDQEFARGRDALASALESDDFVLFWNKGGRLNFHEVADYVRKQRAERLEKHGTVHSPKTVDGHKPKYVPNNETFRTQQLERFVFACGEYFAIVAAADAHEGTTGDWGGKDDAQGKAWPRCPNDGGEISGRPHTETFDCGNKTAFYVQNPRDGREFVINCGTNGCRQYFAKPDNPAQQERLIWLDLLCQRWGVKDAADLLKFCDPETEARKAFERWKGEVGARPTVDVNTDFDVRVRVASEAMKATKYGDDSPYFYEGAEGIVSRLREIDDTEDAGLKAEPLDKDALASELNRIIDWRRTLRRGDTKNVTAPGDVVKEISASIGLGLPKLKGIVRAPFLTGDGEQVAKPGYHKDSGLYHHPVPGFTPIPIEAHEITKDQAIAARDRLLDLIGDFPFTDRYDGGDEGLVYLMHTDASGYPLPNLERGKASRAGALAMIFHPHIMPFFDGASPLYGIDAPLEGSGKGTLVDTVTLISDGREAPKRKFHSDPEETAKDITTALIARARTYVLDNVKIQIKDDALEIALTSGIWNGRILGASKSIEMRMRMQFIATMNNGSYGRDMMRRVCPIRLQPDVVHNRERRFKRDDYTGHVLRKRAELIRDIQLIILFWISCGRPLGGVRLNSFVPWSRTMSGILEAIDMPDLLGNLDNFYDTAGAGGGGGVEGAFVADWYDAFKFEEVTATRLYEQFMEDESGALSGSPLHVFKHPDLPGLNMNAKNPIQTLGNALGKIIGRVFTVAADVQVNVIRPKKRPSVTHGYQLVRKE